MLEFIHGVCESNNLEVYDFNPNVEGLKAKLYSPNSENKNQEYYLFLEYDSPDDASLQSLVKEHIEIFMDTLDSLDFTDKSFRKNCTLILCCKIGAITDQSLLEFEEDPYFFKKNVITYSELELIALQKELNFQHDNLSLNNLLMSHGGDLFESFKTLSLEDNHYYPLLVRVMTKLPFVHYIPQQNQLDDLDVFIRGNLNSTDLNLLDKICFDDETLTQEAIETLMLSDEWGAV